MADKLNSGDIYTNQVGNNLVVVDPNKIVVNGEVKERLVNHEDLVMYANLTARIFPRSKIIAGEGADAEVVVDIFDGELNFLKPKGKDFMDSSWTESFTDPEVNKQVSTVDGEGAVVSKRTTNQEDFQGFGITSINVKINSSYIPQVTINFTDIRGKTLFEQARTNTPYTAFFHLPYPIFYLTLKGYYGKAVRYQLTLEKFVSRFDPSSGDYLVTCDFKGNHIALLRDINMHNAVTAPYMYPNRVDEKTGKITSTKGRQTMSDVYWLYKSKGLIPEDFPEYTIVELIEKVKTLDNDLSKLYGEANLSLTTDKLEYSQTLDMFKESVLTSKNSWVKKYLDKNNKTNVKFKVADNDGGTGKTMTVLAKPLKGISTSRENDTNNGTDTTSTLIETAKTDLNNIVYKYVKLLTENKTFGLFSNVENGKYTVNNQMFTPSFNLFESCKTDGNMTFTTLSASTKVKLEPWFVFEIYENSFGGLWDRLKKSFEDKAKLMANDVTERLNAKLPKELGFKPTIRNVFAILLAGADTYLRLLDDTHTKAMAQSTNKTRLSIANSSDGTPKTNTKENEVIFPWPQYYVEVENKGGESTSVTLKYPGADDVIDITEGNNSIIWPEIEFVEEYTKSANYKFSEFQPPIGNNGIDKDFTPINVRDWPAFKDPYSSFDVVDLLFGVLDRAQEAILYGGLWTRYEATSNSLSIGSAMKELSTYESNNLYEKIKTYPTLKETFKNISDVSDLKNLLEQSSPERFMLYNNFGVVTPDLDGPTFEIINDPQPYIVKSQPFEINKKSIKWSKTNGLFDIAPTVFGSWINNNFAGAQNTNSSNFYSIFNNLVYDTEDTNVLKDVGTTNYLTKLEYFDKKEFYNLSIYYETMYRYENKLKLTNTNTVKEFYDKAIENKLPTEGEIIFNPITTAGGGLTNTSTDFDIRLTSMLNTPYFINSLVTGVGKEVSGLDNPYTESAYLFINSLPLPTFRERVIGSKNSDYEFGDYISQIFNQMPALHEVPISLLLKIGSVWWRYKSEIETTLDPITSIWSDVGFGTVGSVYDEIGNSLSTPYTFTGSDSVLYDYASEDPPNNTMQVGVYPSLIDTIHFLTTGSNTYTTPIAGSLLNTVIGGANLSISNNTDVSFTDNDINVQMYDVFLDSNNITNPDVGVTYNNKATPDRYYILYPSSGGLIQTDITTYGTVTFGDTAIHNGATRLLWGASNYGYFNHNPSYQSSANQYFKKVDNTKDEQTEWSFKENTDYSTIEELRGVFNKEQLDAFEEMFLKFSNPIGSPNVGGSFKEIIKETLIVEEGWLNNIKNKTSKLSVDLGIAQMVKFSDIVRSFLDKKTKYVHRSTTNMDLIVNNSSLLQKIMALHTNSDEYDFGSYSNSVVQIPSPGGSFTLNYQEYQDIRLHVGEYYSQDDPQFNILTTTDVINPIYNFFTTVRLPDDGIEFNSENIQGFAPLIRMYATYCATVSNITARDFLDILVPKLEGLEDNQEQYVNNVLNSIHKTIKESGNKDENVDIVIPDDRTKIKGDDLKLELYNGFKTMNDRWVSGISLTKQTLFEKFLFFDRANRDIGDEAIINIWDILKLDSPFSENSDKTLTQSIASYLSIILANNYFNFIALPSYINFFNVEGDNSQLQGNAMFGTFTTVDYLDSRPAFLCQYVGKPSTQLDVKTPNNGFSNDSYALNRVTSNPLIGGGNGNKDLSNKVMGFNVDFGIPNQNIFESVTLDQSQYQNTAESYKVLQAMADSGGGGATSMASLSLYNVYATRSYTAKITCMGNVVIQPTQYFQLRYLPMFNGPYLITNVEHNITPNNIETSFEGIRVPIPELPNITDLAQRVNKSLFQRAESRLKELPVDLYYDNLSATKAQLDLTSEKNNFIDITSTPTTLSEDPVIWKDVVNSGETETTIDDPERTHLGVDLIPSSDYEQIANTTGITIYATIDGEVTKTVNGCKPLQKDNGCGKYGNYVEVKKVVNGNPDEDGTSFYLTRYAFLRDGINVNVGDIIKKSEVGVGGKVIGIMGNSGISKDTHLHFEILRGVRKEGNIVIQYLKPQNFLPMFSSTQ